MIHGTWKAYSAKCRCDICKQLVRDYQRERRKNNPQVLEKNRAIVIKRLHDLKDYVRTLKNNPCTDCKIKYPYYIMQFDHLDGSVKSGGVASLQTRELIDIEIAKCELVCANCHAERTHKRRILLTKA